ncbi:MAG: hypothetical protein AAF456_16860 [Planctomycetota bacterium]
MEVDRTSISEASRAAGVRVSSAGSSFSLAFLFQIMTACSAFIAVAQWSLPVALGATFLLTPAFVRTGIVADMYRRKGKRFTWPKRLEIFLASVGVVLLALLAGAVSCLLISVLFGAIAAATSWFAGASDLYFEAGILGTAGGIIWGLAGGLIVGMVAMMHFWAPQMLKADS